MGKVTSMIKKIKKDGYWIYYKRDFSQKLAEKVLAKDFEIVDVYKDTSRNYVAKIMLEGKPYVLKVPKSEIVRFQRRIQTIFKKGEGVTSLINIDRIQRRGLNYFATPLCVVVKRGILLQKSFILMEYIEGEKIRTKEDIDQIMVMVNTLHRQGIYHGDLNTSNFIKTKDGIKIIDTQAKSEKIFYFKRAYDIFIMKRDLLVLELGYNVEDKYVIRKGMGYLTALFIDRLKHSRYIEKLRYYRRKWRERC